MGTVDQRRLCALHDFVLHHEFLPSIAARADRRVFQLEYRHRKYNYLVSLYRYLTDSLQFGGVIVFAGIYYAVKGRHVYAGPVAYVRKDL